MRKKISIIALLGVAILITIVTVSCGSNTDSGTKDTTSKKKEPKLYVSEEGRFKIDFPDKPKKKERGDGDFKMTSFTTHKNKIEYNVSYSDHPAKYIDGVDPYKFVENSSKAGLSQFDTETSERIEVDGYTAIRSYAVDKKHNDYYVHEAVLAGNREYIIMMIKSGEYPAKKKISNFFDSFTIIK
ncbi:MAG: hypothetical protein CVU11_13625 [Bacteroidetes bacterium HGW-Bacteroidetes-6]|jgi:hypothetical protein|nr:MAG: hypothetical protein CVU11_13625 [Bacteroidetes bacterium HGW-Bacteroidetes-6]